MWLRVEFAGTGHSICKASLRWSELIEQANAYPLLLQTVQPYTPLYKVCVCIYIFKKTVIWFFYILVACKM